MHLYTLENDFVKIRFLDIGAVIYTFEIKPKKNRNIVLSLDNLNDYKTPAGGYLGSTIGRVAGRIGHGVFTINNKIYQAEQNEKEINSLHGGFESFAFKKFRLIKQSLTELTFEYISIDGEGGYPGEVTLHVIYTLHDDGLEVNYKATTTLDTILNITNHSYFNLDGEGTILNHLLKANATHYYTHDKLHLNDTLIENTNDSPFNIKEGKKLQDIILHPLVKKEPAMGIDHLLLINDVLTFQTKDLILEVISNYPAIQMYSTNFPSKLPLRGHKKVNLYHALAIEPVDIVSHHEQTFNNLLITKARPYERMIRYIIKIVN